MKYDIIYWNGNIFNWIFDTHLEWDSERARARCERETENFKEQISGWQFEMGESDGGRRALEK